MCYDIVTLEMFLIFNFRPINTCNIFLNMENAESEESNATNPVNNPLPHLPTTLVLSRYIVCIFHMKLVLKKEFYLQFLKRILAINKLDTYLVSYF